MSSADAQRAPTKHGSDMMEPATINGSSIDSTSVLIVGAGPTGLTAAVRLAQLGVPHVILDAGTGPTQTSKAALANAESLPT